MQNNKEYNPLKIARIILVGSSLVFILAAIFYSKFIINILDPDCLFDLDTFLTLGIKFEESDFTRVRLTQAYFLSIGLILIFISEIILKKIPFIKAFVEKSFGLNILLLFITIFSPLALLELTFSPIAIAQLKNKTTIYMRDKELMWKLRPNTEDEWIGQQVKVNGKGVIGPELDYIKKKDVFRILYLGDSVTFGSQLKSYKETYPYQVENILKNTLSNEIETVNSGVSGYSPWQEYIYLEKEGIKYNPDFVVVGFVLNDVTEKFKVVRKFGGVNRRGEGFQLIHSKAPLSSKLDQWFQNSGIMFLVKKVRASIRFGFGDTLKKAQEQELYNVESLIYYPNNKNIKKAWKITLENLGNIFNFCKKRDIPLLLVIFPYMIQFEDIKKVKPTPQEILSKFAKENNVPYIDLLPLLSEEMKNQGLKPTDYYIDSKHLFARGYKFVAKIIAPSIKEKIMKH